MKVRNRAAEELALAHQLKILGFKSVSEYKIWCVTHGFSTKFHTKTAAQYLEEHRFAYKQQTIAGLNEKKPPNIKRILKDFVRSLGEVRHESFELPKEYETLKDIHIIYYCCDDDKKQQLKKFLLTLVNEANLLEDVADKKKFISLLPKVLNRYEKWVRNPNDWRVRSHNTYRQFTSLLRHLFCLYEMPAFMDGIWLVDRPEEKYFRWYLHLGKGFNIRNVDGLPIPFTKKMAHWFNKAPANYKVDEAIRYAQVLALGGSQRLTDKLRETQLCRTYAHEEFWETVIRWFIAQPMFDYSHVPSIIDYLNNQKYIPNTVIENGMVVHRGCPQPGLTMKDREPEVLLRQVEQWHTQLGKEKKAGNYEWLHSQFSDFEMAEGIENTKSRKVWYIRELTSSSQLQDEGRKMRHCVSSYASSCKSGRISIWSMEKLDHQGKDKVMTIEVMMDSKTIVQIRGKCNVKATEQEMKVIRRWASTVGLKFSTYF